MRLLPTLLSLCLLCTAHLAFARAADDCAPSNKTELGVGAFDLPSLESVQASVVKVVANSNLQGNVIFIGVSQSTPEYSATVEASQEVLDSVSLEWTKEANGIGTAYTLTIAGGVISGAVSVSKFSSMAVLVALVMLATLVSGSTSITNVPKTSLVVVVALCAICSLPWTTSDTQCPVNVYVTIPIGAISLVSFDVNEAPGLTASCHNADYGTTGSLISDVCAWPATYSRIYSASNNPSSCADVAQPSYQLLGNLDNVQLSSGGPILPLSRSPDGKYLSFVTVAEATYFNVTVRFGDGTQSRVVVTPTGSPQDQCHFYYVCTAGTCRAFGDPNSQMCVYSAPVENPYVLECTESFGQNQSCPSTVCRAACSADTPYNYQCRECPTFNDPNPLPSNGSFPGDYLCAYCKNTDPCIQQVSNAPSVLLSHGAIFGALWILLAAVQ